VLSTASTHYHRFRRAALRLAGAGLIGSLLIGMPSLSVLAQDEKISNSVMERQRPEVDAQGVRLGSFSLFPKIGLGVMSNSNIFATDVIEVDDLITMIKPEVILKSGWSRNRLELGFDLIAARYSDVSTEDYDDWRVWGDGTIDIGRGELAGFLRHADVHEPRTSPDNRRGIEPTLYTSDELRIGYGQPFGQFSAGIEFKHRRLEFDDTITLTGSIDNTDRDRDRNDLRIRIGHETSPALRPFVQFVATDVHYDRRFDRFGFERSSRGYDLVGGTDIDLTGRMSGEAFLGYISRDYEDPRFSTIDGPIFGGKITWNLTGLTTVIFSADRLINGTTIVDAAGIFDTGFGIEVDHELLRNLILSLDIAFNNEDFQGIDRDDDLFSGGIEGIYMMSRYIDFRVGYLYQTRDTSPADSGGFEYRIHRFFVGVEGKL